MAFKRVGTLGNSSVPFTHDYVMTASEACTAGEALVLSSGKLTKCGATTRPQYIALADVAASGTPTKKVPCEKVLATTEYETTASVTVAETVEGSKVTLHTDGLKVTATTTSGVFEIAHTDGVTGGGKVRGYFV